MEENTELVDESETKQDHIEGQENTVCALQEIHDEYKQKLREIRDEPATATEKSVSMVNLSEEPQNADVQLRVMNSDSNLPKQNYNFDLSLEARTSSSQSCPINEIESKILEEQATLKRLLDEATSKCAHLQETILKRDETIANFHSTKSVLEKERQLLKREVELATKEKENAVIRYATVEKSILDAKNAKEAAEKKVKDAQKELEQANTRMKIAITEKNRVCGLFDSKCQELRLGQREIDRLKADLTTSEAKLKTSQAKQKTDSDLRVQAEKRIDELNEEITQLKLNEISRAREEIETEKALVTEKQFMEQSATLILLKHGNEEKERRIEVFEKKLLSTTSDLTEINGKYRQISGQNEEITKENELKKKEIDELQLQLDKEVMKVADLQSKVNEIESLRTQIALSKDENSRTKRDFDSITLNYEELCQEVEKIREKEFELLQFNKELSERCAKLQNECALLNSKTIAVDLENKTIKQDKSHYDEIIANLEKEITNDRQQRNDERVLLTKHIGEKTKLSDGLQKELDLVNGDMEAMKNKHSQTIKELNRELVQLRKRLETLENRPAEPEGEKERSDVSSTSGDSDSAAAQIPQNLQVEPSKKALIERILRLQHATARQTEKIDFLENHTAKLMSDIQKKSKLIQQYMIREKSGALASSKSDKNKAEIAKYGGIMAAVYGGAVNKGTSGEMTLDLSLEINRKLQALLEDTILKNITLKENVDTLGLEVDALMKKIAANK